ncbi:MAG: hypothetical protein EZS28_040289 [Streblomastix strix]|uniref:Uncharacterized protein n=1 Tax=Streblomastix strix TaxID=222440 RepID=A0A5J4U1Q4_9EUKA|nr:MAG: hypothetical protein EZS28_040289 [Streblomastix strix]
MESEYEAFKLSPDLESEFSLMLVVGYWLSNLGCQRFIRNNIEKFVNVQCAGQRGNEIEKWAKQQDRGDSTGHGFIIPIEI